MENQKFDLTSLEVLAQADSILSQAAEEITVETRIEKRLEVTQLIRAQHEYVSLIDRVRNTENPVTICLHCPSYPVVTGEIRFTADNYLVIEQSQGQCLVSLNHAEYIFGVDERAIYRTINNSIDTTMLWLKNLMDANKQVVVYLISGKTLNGQIIRFNLDHFDLVVNQNTFLIPMTAVVLIRSFNETD